MITSSQLRQTRDKLSSVAGLIVSSELPKWKVDIHGLLEYAEKKVSQHHSLQTRNKLCLLLSVITSLKIFVYKLMHKLDDGKYYYDGQQLTEPEMHMNVQFDLSHEYEVFKVLEDCWGGWNSTPRASEMYKIAKRWDENYGLYLDKLSHDTLVFKAKRILTETEITELISEIKMICALPDIEGGFDGVEKCINDDKRLPLWWD